MATPRLFSSPVEQGFGIIPKEYAACQSSNCQCTQSGQFGTWEQPVTAQAKKRDTSYLNQRSNSQREYR